MKTFKEWLKLKEVATTTASVAVFARPIGSIIRRDSLFKSQKKRKKKW